MNPVNLSVDCYFCKDFYLKDGPLHRHLKIESGIVNRPPYDYHRTTNAPSFEVCGDCLKNEIGFLYRVFLKATPEIYLTACGLCDSKLDVFLPEDDFRHLVASYYLENIKRVKLTICLACNKKHFNHNFHKLKEW
jgi:hypothetical protein